MVGDHMRRSCVEPFASLFFSVCVCTPSLLFFFFAAFSFFLILLLCALCARRAAGMLQL